MAYRGSSSRVSGTLIAAVVILAPLAVMVLPTTLMLVVGMIPTAVAYVADREPEKTSAITVGGMNFAGIMPFLIDLWRGGHTTEAAITLLLDPMTWLVMYGAAGMGWGIYHVVPPLVGGLANARDRSKIKDLDRIRGKLVEEWGIVIAGRAAMLEQNEPPAGDEATAEELDTGPADPQETPAG